MKTEIVDVTIYNKIKHISDVYSNALTEEPHLFNKLRDGEKKKMKNHVLPDVIDTLSNTWCCIEEAKGKLGTSMTKAEYFLFIHGLLQVMYVHQDLMDELFWVCKLTNAEACDKRVLVRSIRNELVGHPIYVVELPEGQDLVSTSVWCWDDVDAEEGVKHVEYLYRKDGLLRGQEQRKYPLSLLIEQHEEYVHFCLDALLGIFKEHLKNHIKSKIGKSRFRVPDPLFILMSVRIKEDG